MKPDQWNKARKFAMVRELKPEEDRKQLSLLESSVIIPMPCTTWELRDTVKFYEKRGKCENYIKETKCDMNIGSLKRTARQIILKLLEGYPYQEVFLKSC